MVVERGLVKGMFKFGRLTVNRDSRPAFKSMRVQTGRGVEFFLSSFEKEERPVFSFGGNRTFFTYEESLHIASELASGIKSGFADIFFEAVDGDGGWGFYIVENGVAEYMGRDRFVIGSFLPNGRAAAEMLVAWGHSTERGMASSVKKSVSSLLEKALLPARRLFGGRISDAGFKSGLYVF